MSIRPRPRRRSARSRPSDESLASASPVVGWTSTASSVQTLYHRAGRESAAPRSRSREHGRVRGRNPQGKRDYFASAEQQERHVDLLSGKTVTSVPSSTRRRRSSVMVSNSLRTMTLSLRPRPRNLLKIRIASSIDDDARMQVEDRAIFVGDQTRRRTILQFVPRQREADRHGLVWLN
jgi:hypothetical protein